MSHQRKTMETKKRIWVGVIFIMVLTVGLSGCTEEEKDDLGWTGSWIRAVGMGKIEEKLWSPSTVDWGEIYHKEVNRGYDSDGDYIKYKVWGVLDAQNAFGALIRNSFTVYLYCYEFDNYRTGSVDIY